MCNEIISANCKRETVNLFYSMSRINLFNITRLHNECKISFILYFNTFLTSKLLVAESSQTY